MTGSWADRVSKNRQQLHRGSNAPQRAHIVSGSADESPRLTSLKRDKTDKVSLQEEEHPPKLSEQSARKQDLQQLSVSSDARDSSEKDWTFITKKGPIELKYSRQRESSRGQRPQKEPRGGNKQNRKNPPIQQGTKSSHSSASKPSGSQSVQFIGPSNNADMFPALGPVQSKREKKAPSIESEEILLDSKQSESVTQAQRSKRPKPTPRTFDLGTFLRTSNIGKHKEVRRGEKVGTKVTYEERAKGSVVVNPNKASNLTQIHVKGKQRRRKKRLSKTKLAMINQWRSQHLAKLGLKHGTVSDDEWINKNARGDAAKVVLGFRSLNCSSASSSDESDVENSEQSGQESTDTQSASRQGIQELRARSKEESRDRVIERDELRKWASEIDEKLKAISKRVTRPFFVREYCKQELSKDFDELIASMIKKLHGFQVRQRQKDPTKAKLRRRLVFGLREVYRGTRLGQIKLLIIAPNVEESDGDRSTGEYMQKILEEAEAKKIPYVFALSRRRLGRVMHWKAHISCVGIYSPDGANEEFKQVLDLGSSLRHQFLSKHVQASE